MGGYDIHEDYRSIKMQPVLNPVLIPVMQKMSRYMFDRIGTDAGLRQKKITIPGYRNRELPLEIYSPEKIEEPSPCLIFIHGGAFALPAAPFHKLLIHDIAVKTPCRIIFVDYPLAPKFPYPNALEDCYAATLWALENAEALGIDKNRIALYGDSAGGNLAAGLTHLIRDRIGKTLLFQMLIYPVTDSSMKTESMKKYTDTPLWDSKLSKKMWKLYLSGKDSSLDLKYSSPNTMEDFSNLPPAYVEVSEYDCLRDEGIEYFEKLRSSGTDAVLNKTEGTIHGFELKYESGYTQAIIGKRISYMKSMVYPAN